MCIDPPCGINDAWYKLQQYILWAVRALMYAHPTYASSWNGIIYYVVPADVLYVCRWLTLKTWNGHTQRISTRFIDPFHLALQLVRWFGATPHTVNNVMWAEGFPTISSALRTARKKTSFSSYNTLNLVAWLPGFYLLFSSYTCWHGPQKVNLTITWLHPNVARSLTQVSSLWQASATKANEAKGAKKMPQPILTGMLYITKQGHLLKQGSLIPGKAGVG